MKLTEVLRTMLANIVTFYFQAHGCHWNVEGQDFSQYHALFADIYGDVYDMIDPLAENVRKLGEYAPFNLARYIDLRTYEFEDTGTEATEMARYLLNAIPNVLASVAAASKAAYDEDEQGIANFLADVDDRLKKHRWMLTASLK